jgi:hypothetical protein
MNSKCKNCGLGPVWVKPPVAEIHPLTEKEIDDFKKEIEKHHLAQCRLCGHLQTI